MPGVKCQIPYLAPGTWHLALGTWHLNFTLYQVSPSSSFWSPRRAGQVHPVLLLLTSPQYHLREIAMVRVRYGFGRIFTLLRREGWKDNHKRVYRLYKQEGLNLRSKRPRRCRSGAHRMERPHVSGINQVWSMDFLTDQLFDGKRFRILTVVDN